MARWRHSVDHESRPEEPHQNARRESLRGSKIDSIATSAIGQQNDGTQPPLNPMECN